MSRPARTPGSGIPTSSHPPLPNFRHGSVHRVTIPRRRHFPLAFAPPSGRTIPQRPWDKSLEHARFVAANMGRAASQREDAASEQIGGAAPGLQPRVAPLSGPVPTSGMVGKEESGHRAPSGRTASRQIASPPREDVSAMLQGLTNGLERVKYTFVEML